MKNGVLVFILIIAAFAMNCGQSDKSKVVASISDTEVSLEIEGMVCAVGCAKFIEKTVAELDGVSECNVDFENGIAQVSYASSDLTEAEIVQAINELNDGQYQVNDVEVKTHEEKNSTPRSSNDEEANESEVRFNFPQLVTYFISRIAR